MDVLKNKTLYKVMWLPEIDQIIWRMDKEAPASADVQTLIINNLAKYIDLQQWHSSYSQLYNRWLQDESTEIYNITSEINSRMVAAVKKANESLVKEEMLIFYWFDKDRTEDDDWIWMNDPIDGAPLIALDKNFHHLNRKVSLKSYLVFPE